MGDHGVGPLQDDDDPRFRRAGAGTRKPVGQPCGSGKQARELSVVRCQHAAGSQRSEQDLALVYEMSGKGMKVLPSFGAVPAKVRS